MKRTAVCFAIFSIAFLWLAVSLAAAQDQQPNALPTGAPFAGAMISDWKGSIRLNLPGQSPSAPVRGEVLPPGTLLETRNGRLLLRLSDGSQVLIRAHTRLLVQQPDPADRSYFQLLLGRIRVFINKQTGGAGPFQLGTPSAVITVRGTVFDVEVNQRQVTEVDVFEGLVEVHGLGVSGESVLIEPGFSTRVGIDTPPELPRPTDEMRPEIERPEPGEMDTGERMEAEREEMELAPEISEMMELQEISEEPDVEIESTGGSEPN
jgi:hypothetical protein